MRLLTSQELQVVAGGTDVPDPDEIIVMGPSPRRRESTPGHDGAGLASFYATPGDAPWYAASASPQLPYDLNFEDSDDDGTPDVADDTPYGEEITVAATPEQVAAAKAAYDRAWTDYYISSTLGMGALGGAIYARLGGMGLAIAVPGASQALGLTEEQAINAIADAYYKADGADGVYDGVSDLDRTPPLP